jgi:hypothetical protein
MSSLLDYPDDNDAVIKTETNTDDVITTPVDNENEAGSFVDAMDKLLNSMQRLS